MVEIINDTVSFRKPIWKEWDTKTGSIIIIVIILFLQGFEKANPQKDGRKREKRGIQKGREQLRPWLRFFLLIS